jgi:23S rRNA (cytidine1920-2'-O)/16S rRNA (cytidine1409-2'-O)-methyltransferase
MKLRLDKFLVERGLAASRERAQALILAGKVLVEEQRVDKAGAQVESTATIRLLGEDLKYVSRGGLKLERALEHWRIDLREKLCLDVGASTGGFTDCMLQRGAARVIAIDTGYGQLDFKLRQDSRVRLLEKTNARYLTRQTLGESVSFIAMDVSFISASLVLPAVIRSAFAERRTVLGPSALTETGGTTLVPTFVIPNGAESAVRNLLSPAAATLQTVTSPKPVTRLASGEPPGESVGRHIVVLVKPQFEAGREHVGKGGIVRDPAAQAAAVEKIRRTVSGLGGDRIDVIESPILGAEGNREFLLYGHFT